MNLNFDKYARTGKEFIARLAFELGDEKDTSKASAILRATLHVLRNQSTPEESLQLLSQLPMFIKAVYVDGWKIGSPKGRIRHLNDFVTEIWRIYRDSYHGEDFKDQDECLRAVWAVCRVIADYVSDGELEDFCNTLPEELRELFEI
jgi:uncharacterized protein (DUF2267 family)